MFLGAGTTTKYQKNHKFNELYNFLPSPRPFYHRCRFNARSAINFLCLIIFYYFAFLFVIKVRNFPPGRVFMLLNVSRTDERNVFFAVIRDVL